jgi:hypothetical protein
LDILEKELTLSWLMVEIQREKKEKPHPQMLYFSTQEKSS